MIDIRRLKELVRLMVENDLTELDLQDQQETVTLKRGVGAHAVPMLYPGGGGGGGGVALPTALYAPAAGGPSPAALAAPAARAAGDSAESIGGSGRTGAPAGDDAGLVPIPSPMVGTVYLAANPETPAYASVGAAVGPDTTVCLIEAMKVFSEIKAEVSGTIEKILVNNAQPVQYGQALFMVRPG